MSPRVVLIGLPGSGKSTTGRRLAKMLGVDFADSDELIEDAAGRSIREIFDTDGEAAFRALEAETIATALHDFGGVLALGGGALDTETTRTAVARSGLPVVRLDAAIGTLAARVGDAHTRPLLAGDPAARLRELAESRKATYEAAATLTVPTDNRAPGQVASRIAASLKQRKETAST
jgi:shikimate kinase